MKALVLKKNTVLEYTDVPLPEEPAEKGWVLVKIKSSGICGSDMKRAFGGGAYHYPLVMGHEFAGYLEKVPSGSSLTAGRAVTVFPLLPCRQCLPCRTGDYAQCTDYDYFGSRRDGGFAEYLWVPEENIIPLPDHVSIIHAAMTEPCAVALHGINKFTIKPGSSAAVYGGGPIGNMAAQWLKLKGCRTLFIVDVDREKLAIAENMGFVPVNAAECDPVAVIHEATGGLGTDASVEACGLPLTFRQSVMTAGRFGQVLFMGNIEGRFTMEEKEVSSILRREITIFSTWNSRVVPGNGALGRHDWTTVLDYMDRGINVAPLISHQVPLSDGVEIFTGMHAKNGFFSKVIFTL
ncbi:MAG: galactitol-1-phosphate 5-dehydrogenase [Spirochaetales bacterium]|nr:MAG: galactitol-1-phosphate 5-dehydrogenase [Spirochaetales bacterium]